jgi:hypothetical protein
MRKSKLPLKNSTSNGLRFLAKPLSQQLRELEPIKQAKKKGRPLLYPIRLIITLSLPNLINNYPQ